MGLCQSRVGRWLHLGVGLIVGSLVVVVVIFVVVVVSISTVNVVFVGEIGGT